MSIAVTPHGERWFITAEDKELPDEKQTWWRIRDMTERERMRLMDEFVVSVGSDGQPMLRGSGTRTYLTVKSALIGVDDDHPFLDTDGNPVPFEKASDGRVADEFLALMRYEVKYEMADAITAATQLTQEDVTKSEPSPTDS